MKLLTVNINSISAYFSSVGLLLTIFVMTMLKHYDGQIDWEYLLYAALRIALLSILSMLVVNYLKVSKWYWSIVIGIVVGFLSAALYVSLVA